MLAIAAALLVDTSSTSLCASFATIYTVIASFGVALIFRSLVQIFWGAQNEVYHPRACSVRSCSFDSIRVSLLHLEAIAIIVIAAMALHVFLTRTQTGRSMRAVSDDPELARVAGLDTEKVDALDLDHRRQPCRHCRQCLPGLDTDVHPNLGWNLLLPMFAAAILGGIGKPMGALLGGMVIGLTEELSSYPWIGDGPLISRATRRRLPSSSWWCS